MSSPQEPLPPPPHHHLLLSIPRTASNLLTHLLNLPAQPSILPHPDDGYFFLPALSQRFETSTFSRPYSTWPTSSQQAMHAALRSSTESYAAWLDAASAAGKGTYVKEHVNWTLLPTSESHFLYGNADCTSQPPAERFPTFTVPAEEEDSGGNPTAIPHEIWSRVTPTFLIRHPALAFPSALRTALDNEGLTAVLGAESEGMMRVECSFRWHTQLYRYLISLSEFENAAQGRARRPIVVDASQLVDPAFVQRYARFVGLEEGPVRTQWVVVGREEVEGMGRVERRMKSTLLASEGVLRGKLEGGGLEGGTEGEREEWEREFGEVLAARLVRLVEEAVGEYEWLFERRWR